MRMREEDFGDAGIDLDKVLCAVCGSGEAVTGNDILMCDLKNCYRAFHQRCHHPPIETLPDEGGVSRSPAAWLCLVREELLN